MGNRALKVLAAMALASVVSGAYASDESGKKVTAPVSPAVQKDSGITQAKTVADAKKNVKLHKEVTKKGDKRE